MHFKIALVSCLVLAAACDKKSAGSTGGKSDLLPKLEALATEACACKDMACADAVTAKVTTLGEQNKDFDKADLGALQAAQAKMDMCMAKLNPAIVAYLAISDDACKCNDKACADKVAQRFAEWTAELTKSGTKLRGNDANVAMKAGKTAGECLTKQGTAIPQ
ncbi:MAG: hypothetical protein H0T46_11670 [Deltaproteobacteria bacterium]|nr:hypothetical protein [Deltaproteobacteria bacterium]